MAETYGELISRLCQMRDEMRKTDAGRIALGEVTNTLKVAIGLGVTYEKAKELIRYDK